MLSPRTETILKSIVGQYIARAAPVPSQSLMRDYGLEVSSATIRNEMARLERDGYITRPHPSAGGVPSNRGYRYYVESLEDVELPLTQQYLVDHVFHQVETKLEEWLRLAATLLAHLTHNMAMVVMPRATRCQFKHLELVSLQPSTALLILVMHGARLRQQLVSFDQDITQAQLTAISNKLTGETYAVTGDAFAVETTAFRRAQAEMRQVAWTATPTGVSARYADADQTVEIVYELRPGDHFFQKRMAVTFAAAGGVTQITLGRPLFAATGLDLVCYRHPDFDWVTEYVEAKHGWGLRRPMPAETAVVLGVNRGGK